MKIIDYDWEHPKLKKFLRHVPEGTFLFRQGDHAETLILVLSGYVEISSTRNRISSRVSMIGPGKFLGEKAVLSESAYRRAFSAQAITALKIVELSWNDLPEIRKHDPAMLEDLLRHVFLTSARRLDRTNYVVTLLRSSNNVERMIHLIVYFARQFGMITPAGTEITILPETLFYYIDFELGEIENCLNELLVHGLITHLGDHKYVIPSEEKLLSFVPALSERISSGHYDELESIP